MNILIISTEEKAIQIKQALEEKGNNVFLVSQKKFSVFVIINLIKKNNIQILHILREEKRPIFLKIYCKIHKIPIVYSDMEENVNELDKKYMSSFVYLHKYEIPVLMYHRIIDNDDDKGVCYTYTWVENFEKQMKYIKEKGFEAITFKDLDKLNYRNRFAKNKKYVIITFDDGYEDNYKLAYPILKKYGLKAVIFLVASEKYNKWDVEDPKWHEKKFKMMSKDMIKEMQNYGIEFGGHTLNHVKLPFIDKDEAQRQIINSKELTEELIGQKIITFAYPYGMLDDKSKDIVKKAGYTYAVSTDSGSPCISDDLYQIRRIGIFPKNKVLQFRRKVGGKYNFIKIKREIKQKNNKK